VALRLIAGVRDTDCVARFGGDEFGIVQDMRTALVRHEFEVYYQPIYSIETLRIVWRRAWNLKEPRSPKARARGP
jgi:GGDEF domain-containing protein